MALADYLAKNYLTADTGSEKKSRKRKRKDGGAQGLIVAEDDATGWEKSRQAANEDDDGPLTGTHHVDTDLHELPRLTCCSDKHQLCRVPQEEVFDLAADRRFSSHERRTSSR